MNYVGAIDQGTTSTRFIIFDESGSIVDFSQHEPLQIFPAPGWVEHDATEILENVTSCITAALDKAGLRFDQLSAIGITNQRETIVAWDKTTGDGRDEVGTRALCDAYVAAHPEEFTEIQNLTLEECVDAVSTFRNANLEESQWRVETYLLQKFAPQQIGGVHQPQLRVPGL
jgi:hypothetical protein